MGQDCLARDYSNGGTVCVCNADHCDTIAPVEIGNKGSYLIYISNKAGLRFNNVSGRFVEKITTSLNRIVIGQNETYQEIFGFGGAFTDATGININSLSSEARRRLLR